MKDLVCGAETSGAPPPLAAATRGGAKAGAAVRRAGLVRTGRARARACVPLLLAAACAGVGTVGNTPPRVRPRASAPVAALLLSLRGGGGSRGSAASRQKSRFLANKVSWKVDAHRRKTEQKMRDKLVAQASSAADKRDAEEQRMARELNTLEGAPFDPPRDPASLKAAEARARSLAARYAPGELVEIEDSEEWARATEGDPGAKTHTITLYEDQSAFLRERAEASARGGPEQRETCDEWDIMHPSGVLWGDEKVPALEWGQDPGEIPGLLGDADDMREQEQWVGARRLHHIEQAKAAAVSGASIDVEARARELYALLAREARTAGCDLPQPAVSWDLCFQVALRENVKAQDAALEELRVRCVRYDPEVDDSSEFGAHLPTVEDEFASDSSNSTDMWERRDALGRLLPEGIRRLRPFPTLCQDTLENNPQIIAQLLAGPSGGPPEIRDWKEWELLTRHDVWLARKREQEQARTLIADLQLHLDLALKYDDEREADKWRDIIEGIRREAALIGPNAPTEQDIQDEEAHRAVERMFDMERQTRDLETYEDWKVDNMISSSEEGAEDADAVLDVGQERRAAIMASAKAAMAEEVQGGGGLPDVVEHDYTPSLQASDGLDKSQKGFFLEQANRKALMLQEGSKSSNGLYEDWESFSDTDAYLGLKGKPLPASIKRMPNGGLMVCDFDLPEDLPRYRKGIEIEYLARRKAAAIRMRNVHYSTQGKAARQGREESSYFHEADLKQQRRRVDAHECAGLLYTWGGNMCNQLAIDNTVDQPWVTRSPFFRPGKPLHGRISHVYAGGFHSVCTLREPATVVAFGYNRFGQLGVGSMPHGTWSEGGSWDKLDTCTPEEKAMAQDMFGDEWEQVLGSARDWYGSLDVDVRSVARPAEITTLRGWHVKQVACGLFHTLFLAQPPRHDPSTGGQGADGDDGRGLRVLSCGNNDAGQLGFGHRCPHVSNRSPQEVEALKGERVLSVHAGWEYSLALLEGGTVVGWGWNTYGQLGIGGQGAAGPRACYPCPTAMAGFGEAPAASMRDDSEGIDAPAAAGGGVPSGGGDNGHVARGGGGGGGGGGVGSGSTDGLVSSSARWWVQGEASGVPPPTLSTTPPGFLGGKGGVCAICGWRGESAADMCPCPAEVPPLLPQVWG